MIIAVIGLIIISGLFLFSIAPNKNRREQMKIFEQQYIAHRGLFDSQNGIPENSIPAFQKAVDMGYGIELDVQLTTDNKLVVFHDESLKRMCGVDKKLMHCSYKELMQYKLINSEENIPLFETVLQIIGGKVPLIVEIKSEGDWKSTTKLMAELMDSYSGVYCMESFHPFAVEWFKKNRPEILRGQLSTDYFKDKIKRKWYEKIVLTNLMLNFKSRPDFIAYNHQWCNQFSYKICRKIFPVENVGWTIKNQTELVNAKKVFQVIIFDSFIPN